MTSQSYNVQYKAEVAKFTKKDGMLALCYFAYILALTFFLGFSLQSSIAAELSNETLIFINNVIRPIAMVLPCIVIIFVKKQGLSSIGIHKKNLGAALLLGLVFSAIALMLYWGLLPGLVQGGQLRPIGEIIVQILTVTLVLAAWEDIVCSGFIQTRLHGLIKHNILAVFVGALIFAFIHFPAYILADFIDPGYYRALNLLISPRMIGWIGMHTIHNLLFRKYFSIFPVIMIHTFVNVSQGLLWEAPGVTGLNETVSFAIIVLVVVAWAVYQVRKGKKPSVSVGVN